MRVTKIRSYFRRNGSVVKAHDRKNTSAVTKTKKRLFGYTGSLEQLSFGVPPTIPKQPTYDDWSAARDDAQKASSSTDKKRGLRRFVFWRNKKGGLDENGKMSRDDLRKITEAWPASTAIPANDRIFKSKIEHENFTSESSVFENGSGVVTLNRHFAVRGAMQYQTRSVYFCPGVDLSEDYFTVDFVVPGANLQEANFSGTRFIQPASFEGADLRGTKWRHAIFVNGANMRNADLRGADLSNLDLTRVDLSGANLDGVDLSQTKMSSDLREITLTGEQIKQIEKASGTLREHTYKAMRLEELMKELNLSDKQFEYLILSGVIEIRDDSTKEIVARGFDPEKHHVPCWAAEKVKKSIAGLPVIENI